INPELLEPLKFIFEVGKWNRLSKQNDTIRLYLENDSYEEFHEKKMICISLLIGWVKSIPNLN
ncbi:MAG: hypothetical protein RSB44_14990, partial [Carnobacterium sp.]